jgi:hypothetical protein
MVATEDPARLYERVESAVAGLLLTYLQKGSIRTGINVGSIFQGALIRFGAYEVRSIDELLRLAFLLSPETGTFFGNVRRELQQLRSSTNRRYVTLNGYIRGAINWSQTVPAQIACPGTFICHDPIRSFDRPENRMLVVLVEALAADLRRILHGWLPVASTSSGWYEFLTKLDADVALVRQNPHYRLIPKPRNRDLALDSQQIARVREGRSSFARAILSQYEVYEKVLRKSFDDPVLWMRIASGLRWPDSAKVFELFVAFQVALLLQRGSAALTPIGLQSRQQGWFAEIQDGHVAIQMYYQRLPSDLVLQYAGYRGDLSLEEYAMVLGQYDKVFATLRPDLVADCKHGDGRRRLLLVEVKYTQNIETCRQGLRELIDYRTLTCSQNGLPREAVRGLLCVFAMPADLNAITGSTKAFYSGYAISTAERLLSNGPCGPAELDALAAFCWFEEECP